MTDDTGMQKDCLVVMLAGPGARKGSGVIVEKCDKCRALVEEAEMTEHLTWHAESDNHGD